MGISRSLCAALTHVIKRFHRKKEQRFSTKAEGVTVKAVKLKDKKQQQQKPQNKINHPTLWKTLLVTRERSRTPSRAVDKVQPAQVGRPGHWQCPAVPWGSNTPCSSQWGQSEVNRPNSPQTTPRKHSHVSSTARLSLKAKQLLCRAKVGSFPSPL